MKEDSVHATCPICGGAMAFAFSVPCDYRKQTTKQNYDVFWCSGCEYGQLWGRPSKSEIASFYDLDEYYTHHGSNGATPDEPNSLIDRLRVHVAWRLDTGTELRPGDVEALVNGDDLSICEIGFGNAGLLLRFRAEGFSVSGVEPDPVAREQAKESLDNVYDGTAEDLPEVITRDKYDVVLMSHVLEHCLDIDAALSNARDLLKEGGVFVVETPNCRALGFRVYKGEWPWSDIPRHLNFFTPSSLEKALNKHGLKVVSKHYVGFCRQYLNPWLSTEEEIWSAFAKHDPGRKKRPNFKARAWKLLIRSVWSSKAAKYDSVRLIASR